MKPTIYLVSCINKSDRQNQHERIKSIGGVHNSVAWRKSQTEAISEINLEHSEFYVHINNKKVRVIVAESQYGNEYLKTEADDTKTDNLLSLPECN